MVVGGKAVMIQAQEKETREVQSKEKLNLSVMAWEDGVGSGVQVSNELIQVWFLEAVSASGPDLNKGWYMKACTEWDAEDWESFG